MAEVTYPNILKYGLQAAFDAIETKDTNVLYFCTDTGKIYKGNIDFTNHVLVAASKPESPVAGKLYIFADTNTVEVYAGGSWRVVSYPTATTIDAASDDTHVATAKAVYDAIQEAIEGIASAATTVKNISDDPNNDAQIVVTMGDDSTKNVAITGVVTTPSYDASTRTITLPVSGADDVVVALGKDIFIDPEAENGYHEDTNEIWLYLNDGTEEKEDTLIKVPVAGLVDVYTGGTTTSIKVTVSDDNVVTAAVVLRPDSAEVGSEFTNGLKLGETGLYVDLSPYALAAEVAEEIQGVRETAQAADTLSKSNATAIEIVNGDETTEGSIKKAVKDAKDALDAVDQSLAGRLDTAEGNITDLQGQVTALVAATTVWGTF